MLVQIYEIQTPQEAEKCIGLGVDRIGSVLLSASEWKKPSIREVIDLSRGTHATNSLIPLFNDWDTLCRAMDYYHPPFVHFCETLTDGHGNLIDLSPYILFQVKLKNAFPDIGIVRSIPVPAQGLAPEFPCLGLVRSLEGVSDLLLIDTWLGKEPVEGFVGITGKLADVKRAMTVVLESSIPVILAGGLSSENVFDAVIDVLPAGADSCTHTNQVDATGQAIRFKKDFLKVEKFVKEIRRAEEEMPSVKKQIQKHLTKLSEELQLRIASLPAHSVRPHQLLAIEDLEEEIALSQKKLRRLAHPQVKNDSEESRKSVS